MCSDVQVIKVPLSLILTVRSSKTLIHGFSVVVGCSKAPFCAVCLISTYLRYYPGHPSRPLFIYSNGSPLTYPKLLVFIKTVAVRLGLNPGCYSPHSLRSGSATDAATLGASSHYIQALGRWRSSAYMTYLRPGPQHQINISKFLASSAF